MPEAGEASPELGEPESNVARVVEAAVVGREEGLDVAELEREVVAEGEAVAEPPLLQPAPGHPRHPRRPRHQGGERTG